MFIFLIVCEDKVDTLQAVVFDKNKEDHCAVLQIKRSEYAAKFNSGGRLVNDIDDDYKDLYVIYDGRNVVGFFKLYEQQANELSFFYIILPMYKGKGYGEKSVALIKQTALLKMSSFDNFVALVDKDNIASIKAIQKNQGEVKYCGFMRNLDAVFITIPISNTD